MRFRAATVTLLVVAVLGVGVAASAGAANVETTTENATVDEPATLVDVELTADGDARWTVTTEFVLDDEAERRAFQRLGGEFERGQSDATYSADRFERIADRGAERTDRNMSIDGVTREYEILEIDTETGSENVTIGRLRLSFVWSEFARTTDEQVILDDAFVGDSGPWFGSLSERQTLRIHIPENYSVDSAPPIEDRAIVWEGPMELETEDLQARFSHSPTDPGNGDAGLATGDVAVFGVAILAVVLALGYLLHRLGIVRIGSGGRLPEPGVEGSNPTSDGGTTTDDRAEPGSSGQTADPDGTTEPDDDSTADGPGAASEPEESEEADSEPKSDPDDPFAGVDEELLSDEERVERLLDANDGRMKQATIVDETGWSNAKVSQLLSAMDEDDRIEKVRIGRENLIALPGEGIGELD